jgi:arsenate reductase
MKIPNRIYYLSSCSTCTRILKEIQEVISLEYFELWNLKKKLILEQDLDHLFTKTNSYEALFNKRAQKFRIPETKESVQFDIDFKALILSDYTFLKRPLIIFEDEIFVGNSKATIKTLMERINHKI